MERSPQGSWLESTPAWAFLFCTFSPCKCNGPPHLAGFNDLIFTFLVSDLRVHFFDGAFLVFVHFEAFRQGQMLVVSSCFPSNAARALSSVPRYFMSWHLMKRLSCYEWLGHFQTIPGLVLFDPSDAFSVWLSVADIFLITRIRDPNVCSICHEHMSFKAMGLEI